MEFTTAPRARVSVITVCLNAAGEIARTLASVRAQRYRWIEHVVIDGGSVDGTLERLRQFPPDVLLSEPDAGIYHAMEKGARLASGEILYFLNAGDEFFDDSVCDDVVAFFGRTACDAAFGNLLPVYFDDEAVHDHLAFRPGKVLDFSYFNDRRRFHDECIHHQATFYSKRVFEHCGFLCVDPVAHGEYHLNMCAFVEHGFTLRHMPRTVARFALGGHSTSDFDAEWRRFMTARRYLRNRFFPAGPRIPIDRPDEYLVEAPSLANRLRILIRQTGLHFLMTEFRVRAYGMFRKRVS